MQTTTKQKLSPLQREILDAVVQSRKPQLVSQIFTKVTKTKYHCRVRKVLGELEREGRIYLACDGWMKVK
jgi:hypothetical protein